MNDWKWYGCAFCVETFRANISLQNILPLLTILLHQHRVAFTSKEVSDDDLFTMIDSVSVLIEVIHERINELGIIWRRQRIDIDTQFEYYANGLLNNYYKVCSVDYVHTSVG